VKLRSEAGRPERIARLSREDSNRYSNAAGVRQRSPPQRGVEPVGGLSLQGGADVAVDVGGHGVGRVAEVLLDDLGVRSGREQEAQRLTRMRIMR
jgi:hypothetical protein